MDQCTCCQQMTMGCETLFGVILGVILGGIGYSILYAIMHKNNPLTQDPTIWETFVNHKLQDWISYTILDIYDFFHKDKNADHDD